MTPTFNKSRFKDAPFTFKIQLPMILLKYSNNPLKLAEQFIFPRTLWSS